MDSSIQKTQPNDTATSERKQNGLYSESALIPAVDVIEDGGGITLYADLPGVNRENLNLHIRSGHADDRGAVEPRRT